MFAALLLTACGNGDRPPDDVADPPAAAPSVFRYDIEYPNMGYTGSPADNRVARLLSDLESGTAALEFTEQGGYLDALLDALEIDVSSQVLVFSKTSLQTEGIDPRTPRAIFFNDDTYVAFVQGTGSLEIAAMDARLGPVFYTLAQTRDAGTDFTRRVGLCLRCHDSYSMTGGGVPRFITGSGYIGTDGNLVSHEGWILTSDKTPIRSRWGGWYVTGYHGEQVHLGNIIVDNVAALQRLDELRNGNYETLAGLVDTRPYPTEFSDIVALLVLEHQTKVQNTMTRVNYDVRTLLDTADTASDAAAARVAEMTEPLVEALLFLDEARLTEGISGTSGFAEHFEALGPRDGRGRSLRDFDLETRLFRYPLSYLIYSDAFDALPGPAREYVYRRLSQILFGEDTGETFDYLDASERQAIFEILSETRPEFGTLRF